MSTPIFDPSQMRLGIAGQLSETPVAPASTGPDDGVDPKYRAKATEAAVKFESFFIGHMLHQMRSSTRELASEDSPLKNKVNDDMLDMADNLVADKMAGQRAFGIADVILRQLLPQGNTVAPRQTAAASVAVPQNLGAALNPPQ